MAGDMVTRLVPTLIQPWREDFNILNVMHHGTHEKQISNIFTWLLDAGGSHNLGHQFQRIFLTAINRHSDVNVPMGSFRVEQERNTAEDGSPKDISDIVLIGDDAVVVIENYHKSDGHHHSYDTYLSYAKRRGNDPTHAVVVMLCGFVDEGALEADHNVGWRDKAPVVTYPQLLAALATEIASTATYPTENPKPYWFIDQLVSYFVKGTPVNEDLIAFVVGMCEVGEAERYRPKNQAAEAKRFAGDFSEQAEQRFLESRKALAQVKNVLLTYASGPLLKQMVAATSSQPFGEVSATYRYIYQWTINFLPVGQHLSEDEAGQVEEHQSRIKDGFPGRLQLKFGPSAWFANETLEGHKSFPKNIPPQEVDYSRLLLTWNGEIHQSSVSMLEVLEGLPEGDRRLLDEILALILPN